MTGRKGVGGVRYKGNPRSGFCMELTGYPGSQDPLDISVAKLQDKPVPSIHLSRMVDFLPTGRILRKSFPGECCLTQFPPLHTDVFRVLK